MLKDLEFQQSILDTSEYYNINELITNIFEHL